MIAIKASGEDFQSKIEDAVRQVIKYIKNGSYSKEECGIGHYEFWGGRAYDSNVAYIYDDENLFIVDAGDYVVPNYHTKESFLETISEVYSKVFYTEYEEELHLNIEFPENKVFIRVN